jgi:PAS domain S-box-containing protein
MTDKLLEDLRRQIREAEQRLRGDAAVPPVDGKTNPSLVPDAALETKPASEVPPQARDAADSQTGQLERRLRLLQQSFSALLETSRSAFILVDRDGGWEPAGRHLPEWLGYTKAEFPAINLTDIFEPEDIKHLLASFPQWISGKQPIARAPFNLRSKAGNLIPVMLSSHAWVSDDGNPVAYLVLEDVRPRRNLEIQLAVIRSFIERIANEGSLIFLTLRPDGTILEANPAACRKLGLEPGAVSRRSLHEYLDPATRAAFAASLAQTLQQQKPCSFKGRLLRSEGSRSDAQGSLVAVSDARGRITQVLCALDCHEETVRPATSIDEWGALGRMTPGILKELSAFMAKSIRRLASEINTRDPRRATPALTALLQNVDWVRSMLTGWAAAADPLTVSPCDLSFEETVRLAVSAREAEFVRRGIESMLQTADPPAPSGACPPTLLTVFLHIIQSCLEDIQDAASKSPLRIRIQNVGERVEAGFYYSPAPPSAASEGKPDNFTPAQQRAKNVQLRAAQKLLDPLNGTLVLENMANGERAIRISLSAASLGTHAPKAGASPKGETTR